VTADDVDFVLAVYRDEGAWNLVELAADTGDDLEALIGALWHFNSEVGTLALVSVDEEFFVIVRQSGTNVRIALSDVTTVEDYPLAGDIADRLSLPDLDDEEGPQPAGDMALLDDLGLPAMELRVLCDDDELYPDEVLGQVAERLGFGDEYSAIVW